MPDRLSRGVKIIIGFHLVSLILWLLGQTVAVFSYDTVAGWGLQAPRVLTDRALVEVNRAIGLADTLVMLPLFIVAVVGLLRRRFFGAVASWLAFGMTIYWPVVFWCSQYLFGKAGVRYQPTQASAVLLPAALMIVALWGSWYLARNRHQFR